MKQLTLLFLLKDDEILLAMKKRGFGVGKWNGTGGKVEQGETIHDAAIRECEEEVGVTPKNIEKVGELKFFMSHDPEFGHHGHVFIAREWEGEPKETEEMRPQWFKLKDIPYATMWMDDHIWLPLLLDGKHFHGSFTIGPHDALEYYELHEDPR